MPVNIRDVASGY